MWDIAQILSNDQNTEGAIVSSFSQAATVAAPACWGIGAPANTDVFMFDIWFSTDTAIHWTFAIKQFTSTVALTARSNRYIGPRGGPIAWNFGAQVVAAPATDFNLLDGYAAAGSYTPILNKSWLGLGQGTVLYFITDQVAANCTWTMFGTAYNHP
jgi:hypothetical protein